MCHPAAQPRGPGPLFMSVDSPKPQGKKLAERNVNSTPTRIEQPLSEALIRIYKIPQRIATFPKPYFKRVRAH